MGSWLNVLMECFIAMKHNSSSHGMSLSSKLKKIKQKGGCQELKVVQTLTRKGYDIITTEEVKTPCNANNAPSASQACQQSFSPKKCQKIESFKEPIPFHLEGPGGSEKGKLWYCFCYPNQVILLMIQRGKMIS